MFSLEKSLMLILCFTAKGLVLILGPGWAREQDPALEETDAPHGALEDANNPLGFWWWAGPEQGRGKGEGVGNPAEEEK